MCGIAGIYNRDGKPVQPEVLRQMIRLQRHRGPDDQGFRCFTLQGARPTSVELGPEEGGGTPCEGGLGFCRLSILDVSPSGHQPMCNREGTILLAFNGEIYNAFSIRDELTRAGCTFRSRTDTEVLLAMYEHFGLDETLKRVNGMFAFAIVDLRQRAIHLVRDRLGIKPLYYCDTGATLLFASEAKAFLAHPDFKPELAAESLDEFMLFRYCAEDRHLLRNVHSLLPGHVLTVRFEGTQRRQYWSIPETTSPLSADSMEQIDSQLESALRNSVQRQLLSDVPLGCQFSGGIDSSLVTLFGVGAAGQSLHGISITLEDQFYSEEPWMDMAAARCGVTMHKHTLSAAWFADNLQRVTWHLDQPINHPNSAGIFLLAKHAREFMTVLLSGEGADELFGGYPRYAYAGSRWRSLARLCWPALSAAPDFVRAKLAARFGWQPNLPLAEWFIASSAFLSPQQVRLLRPEIDLQREIARRRHLFHSTGSDYLKDCLRYDLKTYLVDLLVRQDKMTMAHSVENRVPFLDNEMIDLWAGLPGECLVEPSLWAATRHTKLPLKRLAAKHFGQNFAYRPKSGFSLPMRSFFGTREFATLMEEVVFPGIRGRGLMPERLFRNWWQRRAHFSMAEAEGFFIGVALELWLQLFIDGGWKQLESPVTVAASVSLGA
jgi:asparagine synthase (glutamine-hydrolysing)